MSSGIPLVSIGMPIYNEDRFLRKALTSLLAQDYENIQILISDNASTDRTAEIAAEFAAADERITLVRLQTNVGAAVNFRNVMDEAVGDYFMWAAGHDEWSPDLVSESVAALEEKQHASIAFATSYWIDAEGARDDRDTDYPDTEQMNLFSKFFTVFWGNMHPVLGLMRRKYLRKSQGLGSFAGGDLVLLSELILMGDFVHVQKASWNRRDVRAKESHSERLKRYTNDEYGLAKTALDRKFPLFKLPLALIGSVWRSRVSWFQKTILLAALLPALPIRYVVGRRKASPK